MIHLSDEQLYNLAELTMEMQPYNEEEIEQMGHLKECEDCYNKFCCMLALLEVTEESGFMVLSEIYGEAAKTVSNMSKNVLAVVKVARDKIDKAKSVIMEQIEGVESIFQFEPSFAFATRGLEGENITVSKLEDIEDEKTFLVFDGEKSELYVQFNLKHIELDNLKVFIESKGGERLNIPVEKNGNLVCGIMKNIPEDNFEIYIEKTDL